MIFAVKGLDELMCFILFKAAILSSKSILDMTEEEYSRCLNVDLFAAYWVCSLEREEGYF